MASVKWEAGSISTAMSTVLNSIADEANAISSEIDNTASVYLFNDVELYTAALAYATPASGAVVELYLVEALDGTNYEDGNASIDPPAANLVGVFNIRASNAAQRHVLRQIPIPPTKYKYVVINKTGVTLAASGNTLKVLPFRYQTV
jgi:hypothetical protein